MISVFVAERVISEWFTQTSSFLSYHIEFVFVFPNETKVLYEYTAENGSDFMNFVFPDVFDWEWSDKSLLRSSEFHNSSEYLITEVGEIGSELFNSVTSDWMVTYHAEHPTFQPLELVDSPDRTIVQSSVCYDFVESGLKYMFPFKTFNHMRRDKMIIRGDVTREYSDESMSQEYGWYVFFFYLLASTQYYITDDNFPEVVDLVINGLGKYILHADKMLYVIENITECNYCYTNMTMNNFSICAI